MERKCKNCKYWEKDTDVTYITYNENFGWCNCNKFAYSEDLEKYNYETHELEREDYNKYHLIYGDYDGHMATLKVHKEFGCIDFEEKE